MAKGKNNFSKLGLGIALVILGAILILGRNQIATNLGTSFADEPVEVSGFSSVEVAEEKIPKRIIIPELTVDLPVKKSRIVGGYWEVFSDSAGWGEGSGLPGETGNQVIFAHAREGLFLPLKEVKNGMRIYVFTENELDLSGLPENIAKTVSQEVGGGSLRQSNWYAYEVVEIKEVYPNETEVIEPTGDERLTLYTCSGFTDSKRLIVVAKRS